MNYHPRRILKKDSNQLMVTVKEVMSRRFVSVDPDECIDDAIQKIVRSHQTGAPVLNQRRNPVGFLSQKDCLKLVTNLRYFNGFPGTVEDYMTSNVKVLQANCSLFDAVQAFIDNWYHAYPVVNESSAVIGLLTRRRVLDYVNSINQTSWFDMNSAVDGSY
ncbi:CBS domain-containing protein [Pseudobacteriovorax antillogorgiicola]|uniref:CBS domain-containing protein n=1 Tax=Pseudobacteriovorax antillogorgiicola TaxID=1513793 RepID=A0A1Y6BAK0_9BACT|nr:CBS domain-containing protein [Pseudobacteriovorax antillogorgiicola]TCS57390.1 CBS domain protein [Pseudobacteriovorax antillogorgiicola]SMF01707.1 CBS domain-containing protein [Pseudobacteriovorax antillogorgiicola]